MSSRFELGRDWADNGLPEGREPLTH